MRLVRVIGAAALAALVVGGCGSSSPSSSGPSSNGVANESAGQILSSTLSALSSATSVTISGTETKSGKTLQISGVFFSNGDANATLTFSAEPVQLVKIGSTDYLKASSAFWASNGIPTTDLSKLANVWVSISDSLAHVGSALSLQGIASSLTKDVGTLTKGSTSTIDGQAVIAINSSTQGTLYVATTGPAYPVEAVGKSGSSGIGSLKFTMWNQGTTPTPPAGSKTLAQLGLAGSGGGASGASGSTGAPS